MATVTEEGDTLDRIAWRTAGRVIGAVEPLIEANPDLLAHGPVLPAGLPLVPPPVLQGRAPAPVRAVRALWD